MILLQRKLKEIQESAEPANFRNHKRESRYRS